MNSTHRCARRCFRSFWLRTVLATRYKHTCIFIFHNFFAIDALELMLTVDKLFSVAENPKFFEFLCLVIEKVLLNWIFPILDWNSFTLTEFVNFYFLFLCAYIFMYVCTCNIHISKLWRHYIFTHFQIDFTTTHTISHDRKISSTAAELKKQYILPPAVAHELIFKLND